MLFRELLQEYARIPRVAPRMAFSSTAADKQSTLSSICISLHAGSACKMQASMMQSRMKNIHKPHKTCGYIDEGNRKTLSREWPFHSESFFSKIGVVPRFLKRCSRGMFCSFRGLKGGLVGGSTFFMEV